MHGILYAHTRRDDGVALVAAMGIALIGMMVATIVITQTIYAVNDSGRDRTRTAEVHSAEAALDATLAELEVASPCSAPSFSPITYGDGASATEVVVTIAYSDDSGPLTACTDDVIDGLPSHAVVTAVATPVNPVPGVDPERKVVAEVNLEPHISLSEDAAIFTASDLYTGTGFSLSPALLASSADVWIDDGDWTCQNGSQLNGSLISPQGSITFSNANCRVEGDIWVQNDFKIHQPPADGEAAGGDLTVRSGSLYNYRPFSIGQDILVGGSHGTAQAVTAGGTIEYNVGAANIRDVAPVGLPEIEYVPADWISEGFTVASKTDFINAVKASWPDAKNGELNKADDCEFSNNGGNPAIVLPATKTLYDLRTCDVKLQNNITIELYADTVIFLKSYTSTNNIVIKSGDGGAHKFWAIVPHSNGTGTIRTHSPVSIVAPVESFWYTPGDLFLHNSSQFRGQVYGGDVDVHAAAGFEYTNVGVPGVELVSAATLDEGFVVEIVNKREES
ncbi:hypothetical protein [Demequina mangrovi]|uniref:Tfp pilus assembly protein PilX n=1 Tax=Demequina mangrovi TaxID=1043493 RepID=A0A1H6U2B9_9MICO|nr:hypothetical protein [Demequina mangrovi]SEI86433.1 hypothetical protein SAMN05421637_0230 [Demequina mangrovi]